MYHKQKSFSALIKTSLLDTTLQVHPKICTPLLEHTDSNSRKPFCSQISKIEAQLTALKSYVNCKISSLHWKIESVSQSLHNTLKVFQERETKTNEMLHQNTTFIRNEVSTKNEIMKSFTSTQTTILEAI